MPAARSAAGFLFLSVRGVLGRRAEENFAAVRLLEEETKTFLALLQHRAGERNRRARQRIGDTSLEQAGAPRDPQRQRIRAFVHHRAARGERDGIRERRGEVAALEGDEAV